MAALNPLPRWQRRGIHLGVLALAATGLAWLAVHYSVGAGAGELPHRAEAWLMKLHGAAMMAALFFFGSLVSGHAPRGWRMGRQRRLGLALWAAVALLVGSGYALYYFAPEPVRPALGWAHSGAGIALLGMLWRHRRGSQRDGARHHLHPQQAHALRARRHHVEHHAGHHVEHTVER
jgi:hypothetical protein